MESQEYRYEIMVKESMVDVMGHLNHALYLQVFEEARWEICAVQGMTLDRMQERGVGLVVIEAHIHFRKEVRAREKILIKTRFVDVDRKIWRVEQTMEHSNGSLCARLDLKGAIFDLKQRKLLLADAAWRSVFMGHGL